MKAHGSESSHSSPPYLSGKRSNAKTVVERPDWMVSRMRWDTISRVSLKYDCSRTSRSFQYVRGNKIEVCIVKLTKYSMHEVINTSLTALQTTQILFGGMQQNASDKECKYSIKNLPAELLHTRMEPRREYPTLIYY